MPIYVKRIRKIISYLNLIVVSKHKKSCVISSRHFQAFVHTSTAYCQCDRPVLEEVLYPSPNDPHAILQLVEWMDDDTLDSITPK
jgi:fatty acyl-CoA reductase